MKIWSFDGHLYENIHIFQLICYGILSTHFFGNLLANGNTNSKYSPLKKSVYGLMSSIHQESSFIYLGFSVSQHYWKAFLVTSDPERAGILNPSCKTSKHFGSGAGISNP